LILLVDDDADLRLLMRDAIELAEDHAISGPTADVIEFGCGEDALDYLRADHEPLPDLIYMDVEMPGIGGLETVKAIKADASLKHIPIVVLSGLQDVAAQGKRLGANADQYRVKPQDAEHLAETVLESTDYWLNVRQAEPNGSS
jgi:CheY-like chemotaxis protein